VPYNALFEGSINRHSNEIVVIQEVVGDGFIVNNFIVYLLYLSKS